LREIIANGRITPMLIPILKEKAANGLITSDVAVRMIKLCCCKSTVSDNIKKKIKNAVDSKGQDLLTNRREEKLQM